MMPAVHPLSRAALLRGIVALFMVMGMVPSPAATGLNMSSQLISYQRFSSFARSKTDRPGETVLTSPVIQRGGAWNQLVVSWNASTPEDAFLKIEARGVRGTQVTPYFNLGLWSCNTNFFPRESVRGQDTDAGSVDTDTLILKQPWPALQVRVTLGGLKRHQPKLRFLALNTINTETSPAPLEPYREAWGRTLPVPEKSQMLYENGGVLCSPTTVSMLLNYWAQKLKQPLWARDVPEIQAGVDDRVWGGTGNWVFNMAYAGSLPGLRAYVTRLTDLSEVEQLVAAGIPVGLSLCYDRLRDKGPGPSGHLVVCVGFTADGQVILNDPGTRQNVQKVFSRERVMDAWAYSHYAVYIIHPERLKLPASRCGTWDPSVPRRAAAGTSTK
jgi:hypothetical protein